MADQEHIEPVWYDALFRQRRKHGTYRLVKAPELEGPVADTHAHVQMLADPALALARCAVWGVDFVCDIVDVCEEGAAPLDHMDEWLAQAETLVPQLLANEPEALAQAAAGTGVTRVPGGHEAGEYASCADAPACGVPRVRFAIGCHPHVASRYDDAAEALLAKTLQDPRVAALGEVGLDYHYDLSPRDVQRQVFRRQIRLAHKLGKPLALHIREAHDEAYAILSDEGWPEAGTLLHCFDLDWATLEPWLEAGCHVAFGGALTFARCEDTRQAAARAPLDRILLETDSPYMTPEPMRGMECGPAHTIFTAARMAEVRGAAPGPERAALLAQLHANALAFLGQDHRDVPFGQDDELDHGDVPFGQDHRDVPFGHGDESRALDLLQAQKERPGGPRGPRGLLDYSTGQA